MVLGLRAEHDGHVAQRPAIRRGCRPTYKNATGLLPSRPNFCTRWSRAESALSQAQVSLAGDPSEVTALGKRHWITSFHC